MGPCASKKKQPSQSNIQASNIQATQVTQNQLNSQPNLNASNIAVNQPINSHLSNSSMGRSKLVDRSFTKSQVRVQEVSDPKITNFFNDCRTERVELQKVTNEHTSYVRQENYFEISNGHQNELNNLRGLPNTEAAMYGTSEGTTLSTPSLNRFYYDRDIVDITYAPATKMYADFSKPNTSAYRADSINSNTNNANVNAYTSVNTQGYDTYGNNAQGYNTYGSNVQANHNTYSTVQPVPYRETNPFTPAPVTPTTGPVVYESTVRPVDIGTARGTTYGEPLYNETL